jgi:hypothetical protein
MPIPTKPRRKRVKGKDTKVPRSILSLQKVILRLKDGTMVKCDTYSHFSAAYKNIKVVTAGGKVESVPLEDLKAIFFVRDYSGNPDYKAHGNFVPGSPKAGQAIKVTFEDGEVLSGKVINLAEDRPGFFMFPADPKDNNERVFVVRSPGTQIQMED